MRSGRNKQVRVGIGATTVAMAWSLLAVVGPAAAATSVSVVATTQAAYTVGEDAPASVTISNVSSPPESSGNLVLSAITVVPSCGTFSSGECPAAALDPLVFHITDAAGTGGACLGVEFGRGTVVPPSSTWQLVPPSPIVLGPPGGPTSTCQIALTLHVNKRPSKDAQPGTPGMQTIMLASARATSSDTGTVGSGSGASVTTVNRATPTLTTLAEPHTVAVGQPIIDVATVTGVAGGPAPTSGVTFTVYADPPGAAPCSGPVQNLGVVGLTPTNNPPVSKATSPQVTTTSEGTYRFVVGYIGDANYESLPDSECGAPGENVTVGPVPGRYTPLTPARILDTRVGTGGISSPVGPGATVSVQVAGQGGVPSDGVGAVAMNVTVTQPSAANSFLTIFPSGQPLPLASNLNFTAGKTVPNLVIVRLGPDGKVDMYNAAGTAEVIVDVAGWFSSEPGVGEGRFRPLHPARILDTRTGTGAPAVRLGPGGSLDLQVTGRAGVPPTEASAVVMNVAVTNTTGASYLTVHPTGEARPLAANLNWVAGDTVSNRVIAKLGAGGRVTLYNNAGDADVVVDVNGWFTTSNQGTAAGLYSPLTPARLVDTRTGAGGTGTLAAGTTLEVQVTGRGGVPPTGVSAIVVNITAVTPAGAGYLTAFPTGSPRPLASDLNYAPGEIRPNLAVVKLGDGGRISVFTSSSTDLVIDVSGWFLSGELVGDRKG